MLKLLWDNIWLVLVTVVVLYFLIYFAYFIYLESRDPDEFKVLYYFGDEDLLKI
jgi:hypothetical protein